MQLGASVWSRGSLTVPGKLGPFKLHLKPNLQTDLTVLNPLRLHSVTAQPGHRHICSPHGWRALRVPCRDPLLTDSTVPRGPEEGKASHAFKLLI